jgi:hypothetical protein
MNYCREAPALPRTKKEKKQEKNRKEKQTNLPPKARYNSKSIIFNFKSSMEPIRKYALKRTFIAGFINELRRRWTVFDNRYYVASYCANS